MRKGRSREEKEEDGQKTIKKIMKMREKNRKLVDFNAQIFL